MGWRDETTAEARLFGEGAVKTEGWIGLGRDDSRDPRFSSSANTLSVQASILTQMDRQIEPFDLTSLGNPYP